MKPSNILVADDGVVRVFDFGVAVGFDDETALTVEGGVIGTLRYLAPERLAGEPATPATDVWGIGAVLFELLTGKAAFPALTLTERIDDASSGVDRPPGLDDDVWAILDRSWPPIPPIATRPAVRWRARFTVSLGCPGPPTPRPIRRR